MAKHPHRREPMSTKDRAGDIGRDMARLQASKRDDLTSDRTRGSLSPLGGGKYHVRKERGK
jgi:hypothetical protein